MKAVALLGLVLLAVPAGCSAGSDDDALPAYCSTTGGPDEDFWTLVEGSCREATDGDVEQARALRGRLGELDDREVEDAYRTMKRLNAELDVPRVREIADDACLPGFGLGDDLSEDFRSWVIAHGQAAYEAVLDDPEVLADFPDLEAGCGLGEPFGFAPYRELRQR